MGPWLSLVAQALLVAQAATVPVTGTVRDARNGVPIAEAIVSLADVSLTTRTDEWGRYQLDAPPGSHPVRVQRLGYTLQEFDALVPPTGALEINIALRPDPTLLPPIEVRARMAVRGVEPGASVSFPDRSVSQAAIYQHPFLAEPDALRATTGGEVVADPESPSGLHVRGGAADQVAYLIDGIPVFSPYHSSGSFGAINPDALAGVDLVSASPIPDAPEALSGVLSARTRSPLTRTQTRGSVSATQARAMVEGPLGGAGAGYLLSVGSAFPGLAAHKDEPSHITGDNLDLLGKVETPIAGGRLRLLAFASRSEINSSAFVETDTTTNFDPTRNAFGWDSQSFGAEWRGSLGATVLTLRSWSASARADATWVGSESTEQLASRRRDDGLVGSLAFPTAGGSTHIGTRMEWNTSSYDLARSDDVPVTRDVDTPVTTIFAEHARPITRSSDVSLSLANSIATGENYVSPGARVRWSPARNFVLSGSVSRRHQFSQSLRNPESIVSNIFPADLSMGAGQGGVPVARSEIGILALEHRPREWLRVGAQAYVRNFTGLALVAPRSADPFSTRDFATGTGDAHGFSLEAAASGERIGFLASYGYQRVHLDYAGGAYVPDFGATHTLEAGVLLAPAPSYSIRVGFESAFGRRTTAAYGSMEWEACNLLDQGCEFAGGAEGWSGDLGGTPLPAYFRLDLGVRKQWHVRVGEHEGRLALFGTATNLLSRANVLTVAVDPTTGQPSPVEMRPFSPLVVGIDWRF